MYDNFQTAIAAAAYITSRIASSSPVALQDKRTLTIGSKRIYLPELDGASRHVVDVEDIVLRVTSNHTFEVDDYRDDYRPAEKVRRALARTGFTPRSRFSRRHARNLERYGYLFDEQRWHRHLEHIVEHNPEAEPLAKAAHGYDITMVSQAYIDMLIIREGFLPKLGRAALVAGAGAAAGAGLAALHHISPAVQQLWEHYVDLLHFSEFSSYWANMGVRAAANTATVLASFLLGDICAQYIEGRGFDSRRFANTARTTNKYGIEFTAVYELLNMMPKALLGSEALGSLAKAVVDVVGYGCSIVHPRHVYLMSQEKPDWLWGHFRYVRSIQAALKDRKLRKRWWMMNKGAMFWIPFQTWNRVANAPEEAVFYVSLAMPVWTVFMSLVSNQKRDLLELEQAMALLDR